MYPRRKRKNICENRKQVSTRTARYVLINKMNGTHFRLCKTCNKTYVTVFKYSKVCDKCKIISMVNRGKKKDGLSQTK